MPTLPKVLRDSIARLASEDGVPLGTCFLISRRHVLTCHHCVSGPSSAGRSRFKVQFLQADGSPTSRGEVVWTFPKHDMAVLELEDEQKLTPISLGEPCEDPEWSTLGYPQGSAQLVDGDTVAYPVKLGIERETEPGWVTVNSPKATHNLDGISGAPIIVGGKAIGVITNQRRAVNGAVSVPAFQTLLAIPIHHLSTAHEMIRRASHHEQEATSFCPHHHKLRSVLSKKVGFQASAKGARSDLHYLIVQVPASSAFPIVKRRLLNLFREPPPERSFTDPAIWTLLGSAEFLVMFRASRGDAERLYDDLGEEEGSVLWRMDISEEKVPEPGAGPSNGGFRAGRLAPPDPMSSQEFRSSRAFIRIQLERGRISKIFDTDVESILAVAGRFSSVVERVSVARATEEVMIDLHMACGLLPVLNQLSSELEKHLARVQRKDTFLAYDALLPAAVPAAGVAPRTLEGSV